MLGINFNWRAPPQSLPGTPIELAGNSVQILLAITTQILPPCGSTGVATHWCFQIIAQEWATQAQALNNRSEFTEAGGGGAFSSTDAQTGVQDSARLRNQPGQRRMWHFHLELNA